MEHLSFASYLAKGLKMTKTWPHIGSSWYCETKVAIYIHCQGTEASQGRHHSFHSSVEA